MGGSLQYLGKGCLGHRLGLEFVIQEHGSGSLEVATSLDLSFSGTASLYFKRGGDFHHD